MFSGSGPGARTHMTSWMRIVRRISVLALATAAVAALAPAAATPAKSDAVVAWNGQTPSEGVTLGVAAKTQLSVPLAASASAPEVTVRIRSTSGSPQGAKLLYKDGNPARATFTWTPAKSQIGVYHVTFTAGCGPPRWERDAHARDSRRPAEQATSGTGRARGRLSEAIHAQ